jgi:hypothetical protein
MMAARRVTDRAESMALAVVRRASPRRYRGLGVIRFGKRWAVLHYGVMLAEFPSRHFARMYRRALYWGDIALASLVFLFSFMPDAGLVN